MAAGNRSVLVVLDSRRRVERAGADQTVFAALDHFGVAYEVLECGDYVGVPPGHVAPPHAAHPRLRARRISITTTIRIATAASWAGLRAITISPERSAGASVIAATPDRRCRRLEPCQ